MRSFRRLLTGLVLLALAAPAAATAETIDTTPSWDGDQHVLPFGRPDTATYGQLFTPAQTGRLQSFSYFARRFLDADATQTFRGQLYAWDGHKATGPALWESAPRTVTFGSAFQLVEFSPGVVVQAGQPYVFFSSVSKDFDENAEVSLAEWGAVEDDAYAGGNFVFLNNGGDASKWTTEDWSAFANDLAFRAVIADDDCGSAAGPAACWTFDETSGTTAADSSGNGNTGRYLNGPVLDGDAVDLDGVNDAIRVADSPSLDVGDSFTLEAWVERDSTSHNHQLFNKGTNGFQLTIYDAAGGNQVALRKAGVKVVARTSGGVPADGAFHHVVATKDGSAVAIYIDGVAQTLTGPAVVPTIANTSAPLFLSGLTRAKDALDGRLDQAAVYDRALTPAEVAATAAG